MVYTVVLPEGKLPVENLTYLAAHSKKAVYQEHICDEAALLNSRQKKKQAGSQRGFIVRVDQEETPLTRIVPWFKGAAQKLLDADLISRVDAEDSTSVNKKKGGADKDKKQPSLGANECHVETTYRVHHFAHGPGFRVEVTEGIALQRINFFTNRREISHQEWHGCLTEAIEKGGGHVMVARRPKTDAEAQNGEAPPEKAGAKDGREAPRIRLRKDAAQQEDDAWLDSMMMSCMVLGETREADCSDDQDAQTGAKEPARPSTAPPRPAPATAPTPRVAAAPAPSQARATVMDEDNWRRRQPVGPSVRVLPKAAPKTGEPKKPGGGKAADGPRVANARADAREDDRGGGGGGGRAGGGQGARSGARNGQAASGASGRAPPPRGAAGPTEGGWRPSVRIPPRASPAAASPKPAWTGAPLGRPWDGPPQRAAAADAQDVSKGEALGASLLAQLQGKPPDAGGGGQGSGPTCAECQRGRPLKLFVDGDDGESYCRMCWVHFYGCEPPGKP